MTHAEDVFTIEYPIGRRVAELSKVQTSPTHSEEIFGAFVAHLKDVAARGAGATKTASAR